MVPIEYILLDGLKEPEKSVCVCEHFLFAKSCGGADVAGKKIAA